MSAVLAALNEGPNVHDVIARAAQHVDEVVVVDDGSDDDTARVAQDAGARVISLSRNHGKGVAMRRGVIEAHGERIVLLDADGQDDPDDIPVLLEALYRADMVIGSRFLGRFEPDAITPLHALGNRGLTTLINTLYGVRLSDTQAGFRALRRETFMNCELRAQGFDIETDVLLEVLRNGGGVTEVPVTRSARTHGHSHLGTLRDGTRILSRALLSKLKPSRAARDRSSRAR